MQFGLRRHWLLLLVAAVAVAAGLWRYWPTKPIHARALMPISLDPPASSPQQRTPDHLRVLFVGNSFTNFNGGQALMLKRLADAAQPTRRPIVDQVTFGGSTLKFLWTQGQALARIREGNWDYVVLQENSTGTLDQLADFEQYTGLFDAEIRRAGARTVLFMTWCRKDEPQNQIVIANAYREAAQRLHAVLAPVGLAFEAVRLANPSFELYAPGDNPPKHPNEYGSYLAACVFYRLFYGSSAVGLTRVIADDATTFVKLSPADAEFLQRIADQTVAAPRDAGVGEVNTLNEIRQ